MDNFDSRNEQDSAQPLFSYGETLFNSARFVKGKSLSAVKTVCDVFSSGLGLDKNLSEMESDSSDLDIDKISQSYSEIQDGKPYSKRKMPNNFISEEVSSLEAKDSFVSRSSLVRKTMDVPKDGSKSNMPIFKADKKMDAKQCMPYSSITRKMSQLYMCEEDLNTISNNEGAAKKLKISGDLAGKKPTLGNLPDTLEVKDPFAPHSSVVRKIIEASKVKSESFIPVNETFDQDISVALNEIYDTEQNDLNINKKEGFKVVHDNVINISSNNYDSSDDSDCSFKTAASYIHSSDEDQAVAAKLKEEHCRRNQESNIISKCRKYFCTGKFEPNTQDGIDFSVQQRTLDPLLEYLLNSNKDSLVKFEDVKISFPLEAKSPHPSCNIRESPNEKSCKRMKLESEYGLEDHKIVSNHPDVTVKEATKCSSKTQVHKNFNSHSTQKSDTFGDNDFNISLTKVNSLLSRLPSIKELQSCFSNSHNAQIRRPTQSGKKSTFHESIGEEVNGNEWQVSSEAFFTIRDETETTKTQNKVKSNIFRPKIKNDRECRVNKNLSSDIQNVNVESPSSLLQKMSHNTDSKMKENGSLEVQLHETARDAILSNETFDDKELSPNNVITGRHDLVRISNNSPSPEKLKKNKMNLSPSDCKLIPDITDNYANEMEIATLKQNDNYISDVQNANSNEFLLELQKYADLTYKKNIETYETNSELFSFNQEKECLLLNKPKSTENATINITSTVYENGIKNSNEITNEECVQNNANLQHTFPRISEIFCTSSNPVILKSNLTEVSVRTKSDDFKDKFAANIKCVYENDYSIENRVKPEMDILGNLESTNIPQLQLKTKDFLKAEIREGKLSSIPPKQNSSYSENKKITSSTENNSNSIPEESLQNSKHHSTQRIADFADAVRSSGTHFQAKLAVKDGELEKPSDKIKSFQRQDDVLKQTSRCDDLVSFVNEWMKSSIDTQVYRNSRNSSTITNITENSKKGENLRRKLRKNKSPCKPSIKASYQLNRKKLKKKTKRKRKELYTRTKKHNTNINNKVSLKCFSKHANQKLPLILSRPVRLKTKTKIAIPNKEIMISHLKKSKLDVGKDKKVVKASSLAPVISMKDVPVNESRKLTALIEALESKNLIQLKESKLFKNCNKNNPSKSSLHVQKKSLSLEKEKRAVDAKMVKDSSDDKPQMIKMTSEFYLDDMGVKQSMPILQDKHFDTKLQILHKETNKMSPYFVPFYNMEDQKYIGLANEITAALPHIPLYVENGRPRREAKEKAFVKIKQIRSYKRKRIAAKM